GWPVHAAECHLPTQCGAARVLHRGFDREQRVLHPLLYHQPGERGAVGFPAGYDAVCGAAVVGDEDGGGVWLRGGHLGGELDWGGQGVSRGDGGEPATHDEGGWDVWQLSQDAGGNLSGGGAEWGVVGAL